MYIIYQCTLHSNILSGRTQKLQYRYGQTQNREVLPGSKSYPGTTSKTAHGGSCEIKTINNPNDQVKENAGQLHNNTELTERSVSCLKDARLAMIAQHQSQEQQILLQRATVELRETGS